MPLSLIVTENAPCDHCPIFQEIKAFCDYHQLDTPAYWRSQSRIEVDFVFEDLAVEVKARKNVIGRDLKGLRALREEGLFAHYLLVSMEPMARETDGIRILPWTDFPDGLWGGEWTPRLHVPEDDLPR